MKNISPGTLLNDRYRLDRIIGRGGMGVVFRAHDTLLDRDVAVKVISAGTLGSRGHARLLHEAQAIARLNHPNIVRVYDAGKSGDLSFVVMELLSGESLFDRRPETFDEIIAVTRQICSALQHAHANGIIHRDLKLENVLVSPDGRVVLTDFGLARSVASRVTVEGAIVGTVFYLAPEQVLGQPLDGRTDLYALGVMLYELAAKRLPFTGDDPLTVISQHLHAPVVPPSTYNDAIPANLEALILSLLSKRPEDRPASAEAVLQALDNLSDLGLPQQSPELSPLDRLARGRLIGREKELAEAKAVWKQVLSSPGERHALAIHGEPGVGKTPLLRELKALAEVSGGRVFTGECYPDVSAPYAPFAQIIRSALAATPLQWKAASEDEDGVQNSAGSMSLPQHILSDLLQLAPELQARYPQVAPQSPSDPSSDQQRLFESVVAFCAELASRSPILLTIEDVHWADSGTLYLARHLARRSRTLRLNLLILLAYRDTDLDTPCCLTDVLRDMNQDRLLASIRLERYSRQQTATLLSTMFQETVDQDLLDAIYRVTEGNLFFVEEVCKALIEEGKLYRQEGRWRHSSLEAISIPESVQATIQARVSKLPAEAQDILRLASVIGREFDFNTLEKASQTGEESLISALEVAERAQLIREVDSEKAVRPSSAGIRFSFAHALTYSTLLNGLSSLRRRNLHRRVARALEELGRGEEEGLEALAYHYEQAGDFERARAFYSKAGERALAVYANREAERFFRAALGLSAAPAEQALWLSGLGEALFRQALYQAAGETWLKAIELYRNAGDPDNLARLYARSARAAWFAGDPPRGLALCKDGLEVVRSMLGGVDLPDMAGIATLLHETARAYRFNDQPEPALALCRQALAMAERLDLKDVQADSLATLGILPNQTLEERGQALTQAVELAESAALYPTAARAHLNLSSHYHELGDFRTAIEHVKRARELARIIGIPTWEHDYYVNEATYALDAGDFQTAQDALQAMRRLHAVLPDPAPAITIANYVAANLLRMQGDWEQAVQLLETTRQEARERSDYGLLSTAAGTLAEIWIETGQLNAARQALEEVLSLEMEQSKLKEICLPIICLLSMVVARQGDIEGARRQLELAREMAAGDNSPKGTWLLAFTEARLHAAQQDWPAAIERFNRTILLVKQLGFVWYQATIMEETAQLYAASAAPADRSHALELLKDALALFEGMGATGYVERVRKKVEELDSGSG